ncbi:hypothetical protein BWQ96_01617 [Gracilariopsis chorda]|uniref:Uncharacterized protein n=2 Tax=Gracilariopsis chorda TaxID=448386 RepID=A0A2V3J234_9FLOR|nr:hypothetical protein BWQ96_01617 [Gracilariopsis chorda]|eukprot:PXF48448.1 hypothetical protein BWQ96_01617 [Gracilariopsis chorda]
MMKKVGAERNMAAGLYNKAVHAPTREMVGGIVALYGPNQLDYLSKFPKSQLYRAYSSLEDLKTTTQGAESQMAAALRNHIRAVEPQKMLEKVLMTQRKTFLSRQTAALACRGPVPPFLERQLASIINRSRGYLSSVTFIDGTRQMEATVPSQTDASVSRRITLRTKHQTPPMCCSFSLSSCGYPHDIIPLLFCVRSMARPICTA